MSVDILFLPDSGGERERVLILIDNDMSLVNEKFMRE